MWKGNLEPKTVVEEKDLLNKALKYIRTNGLSPFLMDGKLHASFKCLYSFPQAYLNILICTRLEYCQLESKIWIAQTEIQAFSDTSKDL